jgi:hypothetical protein
MSPPEIKIIALSNVYTRLMHFLKKGDIENGHIHTFDHATLVSSGAVLVETLDENLNVVSSKEFYAPNMVFIDKNKKHRLIALEDNTVCGCIHAVRTMDEEILDPDFLIEPVVWNGRGKMNSLVLERTGKKMIEFIEIQEN